jgi:magnesium-transporting ATPase (P-type)
MDYKTILKKHINTKQTGFILAMVFLYALLITAATLGLIDPYQGNYISPAALLLFAVLCPVLSAYLEFKSPTEFASPEATYMGFKNAADSLHEIPDRDVAVGDVLFLSRGDVSPCGGKILEGDALIDTKNSGTGFFEKSAKKHAGKRSENYSGNTIDDGDTVVSGTIKIEVTDIPKSLGFTEKSVDVTDIFFAAALVLSVCLAAVRLVAGGFPDFLMFGSEVILDNVAAAVTLCMIIPILGQGDLFLRKLYLSKWGEKGIKCAEYPVENNAKTEEICADISFLENTVSINFTSGELRTYDSTEKIPEKVMLSAALCVYRNYHNRFGLPVNNADMKAAADFFGMGDYHVTSRIVGAVHYSPEDRFSAVTVKTGDSETTVLFGDVKLIEKCGFYMDDEGEVTHISESYRGEIASKLAALASKGVKARLCAESKAKIEDGELPDGDFTLIGFVGFATVISPENAAAVRELYENGIAVRLVSHEAAEYNNFLSGICAVSEIARSPVFYGEKSLVAINEPDFTEKAAVNVCSEKGSMWAKKRADFFAESIADIARNITSGKMFGFNRNLCAVLSATAYLMIWAVLMFVLSILPVPFADSVIPIILLTALLLGFLKTKIIGWKAY